jgi:hypothetical protein
MEEKYILTTKSYEDWRNYLLVNSFFFDVLLKKLRKDLCLPEDGIKDLSEMMQWDANKKNIYNKEIFQTSKRKKKGIKIVKEIFATAEKIRREVYSPIWEMIEKFFDYDLDFSLLHTYVLGNTNISTSGSSRVSIVTSPQDPINETGVYIKYSPYLSEKDITLLMKQAKESYKSLFNYTHPSIRTKDENGNSYIKRPKLKIRQRKTNKPTNRQLKIYNAVENFLKGNYSSSSDSIKMEMVFKGVSETIKENAGSIQRTYYTILNNYNLPSSVDIKKISV